MNQHLNEDSKASAQASQNSTLSQMLWSNRSKWGKFWVIVLVVVILSTIASLVTRSVFFSSNYDATHKIAVIVPLSGDNKLVGLSLQRGAELYVKKLNETGGIDGQFFGVEVFDNKGDADLSAKLAKSVVSDKNVVAVIGPWTSKSVAAVAKTLDGQGVSVITPSPSAHGLAAKFNSLYTLTYDQKNETWFLANYMRNVLQEKLVSVVFDSSANTKMADEFGTAFERFGIPLRHRWSFDSTSEDAAVRLAEIVKEIKAANDSGAIYLAMNERQAANLIMLMRQAKAINRVMGPHGLGTQTFAKSFGTHELEKYTNGIITAAPLMYDIANQNVQAFRSNYLESFKETPDWIAAYGYESANIIGELLKKSGENGVNPSDLRTLLTSRLVAATTNRTVIKGLSRGIVFNDKGAADQPIQVGVYDGRFIISAPTQLLPISAGEVSNYIQAVRDGRALYVNDRFMYKTNVVYSGILIDKILAYDQRAETIEMQLVVWFRYQGKFKPQDVVFENAVDPIKLDKPDRSEKIGALNYLRYRVKGKFRTDFLNVPRNYGSKLMGTSFRHRLLNKNNLIYVVDVVGIGLTDGGTYKDRLKENKTMPSTLGMVADQAWISQDIVRKNGLGDPNFVGHGKPSPDFSQLEAGIIAVDGTVSLRDIVPSSYLIYLTIFGFLGSIAAFLMDRKRDDGKVLLGFQSWLLRLVCWPVLLASGGNLALNFAFQNLDFYYVDLIVPVYESLWWIAGAFLVAMAVERFIWQPLERRAERKVPGAIRALITVAIFAFASFGIIAFVMHQELTSLLATSGLLAMIVGLAVQANIANIFSGIVLNLERPFRTGDWIKTTVTPVGRVVDVTWRSTKIRTFENTMISLPNSTAAETQIENFSHPTKLFRILQELHFAPHHDPLQITDLIYKGLENAKCVDGREKMEFAWVKLIAVDEHGFKFNVRYDCTDRDLKNTQDHEVLTSVIASLNSEDIRVKTVFPGKSEMYDMSDGQ